MRLILTICLALIAQKVNAEDWAEFRGPQGKGIYAGKLPTEWGPNTNVTWKTEIPGHGWSSPILWKGKLYLTTATEGEKKDTYALEALCVDAATGNVDWRKKVIDDDGSLNDQIHKRIAGPARRRSPMVRKFTFTSDLGGPPR